MSENKLKIALDWTPNINHTGLFVAEEEGYYKKAGVDVEIIVPDGNDLKKMHEKLSSGEVDLALLSPETLVASHLLEGGRYLRAVGGLLQSLASTLLVKKNANIHRPSQLKGKTYGSCGLPLENEIIRQLIIADNGEPDINIQQSDNIYQTFDDFLDGKFDFIWGYIPWELDLAKKRNIELDVIPVSKFIPYVASPLIVTTDLLEKERPQAIRSFLEATQMGYEWVSQDPERAVDILVKRGNLQHLADDMQLLRQTQRNIISYYYLEKGKKRWGAMHDQHWEDYVNFLLNSKALSNYLQKEGPIEAIQSGKDLFTNDYLPSPTGSAY